MISIKSTVSFVASSIFILALSNISVSLASEDSASAGLENKVFMVAEAHQHGQERGNTQGEGNKHRHGQDKENGQGHKGGEDKGSHSKDKGEGDKHGDKKSGGMKKDGHDYAHMVISHTDALKLSNEQLGKIVRLHLKNEKEHEQLKEKLKESMQAFKKESMKPSTTDARLHKLGKDHTDAFNAMVEHHIKERQTIHAILSEDQKKQLNTMKMDHDHDAHGDKHGGHGDH